ncbi:MAG: IS110 family transposase [Clostridiales bacterium]|jgi:transposase|nr:IS110 family transposase [Clostridiales bacterium]
MFYVGIDIAKHFHQAAVLGSDGKTLCKPFSFPNTADGRQKIIDVLDARSVPITDCTVAMEATGQYWLSVYSFFSELGFDVKVINPIQTDSFRNLNIRKCKNDVVDSVNIAELVRFGKYSNCAVHEESVFALKNLSRFRLYLTDPCADLKKKAICLLDQVFPEYADPFSDTFGLTSRELLLKFSTPEEFLAVSTVKLANLISKASRGRLGKIKAEQVKQAAQNSFGVTFAVKSFSFQLKLILEQINFTEQQIADLEAQLSDLLNQTAAAVITSITGIGTILAATIIGEIGDINRFDSPKKLLAYSGLDASVVQSGQFVGSNSKVSKRGSPYLRRAIYLAANVAAFKDQALSLFYQKKISQGKHHKQAVIAVAHKPVNIIRAVRRTNALYVPRVNN